MEIVKEVKYLDFSWIFEISLHKTVKIRWQYSSDDECKEAVIYHALQTHPCLTWKRLSDRLRSWGYNEAAAEVTRKYMKGQW